MRIEDKLDTIVRKIVRARDSNWSVFRCISCGELKRVTEAENGHYIPRSQTALRWDLRNCNLECLKCNRFDQDHLKGYRLNLIKKIGLTEVQELEALKNTTTKLSDNDKEELLKQLKIKLKQYETA